MNLALNGFDGALGSARAAVDASGLVNLILAAGILNSADGALSGAGAAGDAGISNFVSHKYNLLLVYAFILA